MAALKVSRGNFDKVAKIIRDLISRLEAEAAEEVLSPIRNSLERSLERPRNYSERRETGFLFTEAFLWIVPKGQKCSISQKY